MKMRGKLVGLSMYLASSILNIIIDKSIDTKFRYRHYK